MSENTGSFGEFVSNNHGVDLSANDSFGEFLDNYDPTPKPKGGFINAATNVAGSTLSGTGHVLKDIGLEAVGNSAIAKGKEIQDNNPAAVNSLSDIAKNPGTWVAESAGGMAGQAGEALAGGLIGGYVGGGLGALTGPLAPIAIPALSAAGAYVGGNIPMLVQEYGSERDQQSKNGIDDKKRALAGAAATTAIENLGGFKPGGMAGQGKKIVSDLAGKTTKEAAKTLVKKGIKSGVSEGLEEIPQQYTGAYGGGTDIKDLNTAENAQDAAFGAAMAFPGGAMFGSVNTISDHYKAKRNEALDQTASTGPLGNALASGGLANTDTFNPIDGSIIDSTAVDIAANSNISSYDNLSQQTDSNSDNTLDLRTDAEKAQDNASVINTDPVINQDQAIQTGLQGTPNPADAAPLTQTENLNGSQESTSETQNANAQEEGLLGTVASEQSGATTLVDNAPHDPLVSVIDRNTGTAFHVLQSDLDSNKDRLTKHSMTTGKRLLTPILRQDIVDEQTYQQELADQQQRQDEQTNQQTETQAQDQTGADQGTAVTPSYATAPLLNKRTNKPFKTRKMAEAAIASSSNPTLNKQDHIPVPVDGGFGIAPKPNTTQESNDTTAETQSVLSNTGTNAKGITAPATTDATGQGSTQTAQEVDKQPWQMTHDEYWKAEDKKYEANRLERLAKVNNELDTLKNKSEGYDAIIAKEIGKVPHTITNDGKFSHNLRSGSYKHNNAHEFVVRQLLKRRKSIESSSGRFRNSFVNDNKNHHAAIQKAIDEGQTIPKNVLDSLPSNFPEFKSDATAQATENVAPAQEFGNLSNNEQSNKESQQNTQSIIPKDSKKLGLAITRAAKIDNRSFNDMPGMYSQGSEHQGIDIHSINQTKDINGNPDYIIHVSNRTRVAANGHKTTEGKYSLNALLNSGAISQKTHDFLVNEHNQNINAATETNNDHELTATQYVDRESKGFTANKQINDSLRKAHYTAIRSHLDQGGKISQEVFDSLDGLQRSNLNKNYGEDIIQSPAQEVAKKPDWEMTRDEYKNSFDPRDYKDSNYDRMIHGAVFNEKITQAEADKKLIRDYHGNKYHWAKTRKELEQEKKEAVKNAKAARAEGNKNPIHSVKWAQKSESNTAKNNITSTNLYHNKLLEVHQERVQEALSEGKPVPQEVLADYPGLQKPAQETANPINDNANVSKKGENAPSLVNWRTAFKNASDDVFKQNDILRGIADISKSASELDDVVNLLAKIKKDHGLDVASTAYAVFVNKYSSKEAKQKSDDMSEHMRPAKKASAQSGDTAKPEWHIDIPEQGLAILPAELKGEGYRAVAGRIAKDAVEAITQNQKIANDTLYLYFLPAAENYNAIARYFPEDQKPGGSWQIADSQGVRAGSLTNDQLLYKTESIMGNKPILGWEKTSTDAVNVIGKGNSGDVTRIDNEVEKNATGNEAKVYELLKGVEGVAKGYEHDGKIRLPFYEHIISIDTIPKDDRESLGSLVSKNKDRIISAVNSLTNIGYDYNDPLQFGMNKDQQFDLLDFSMAENNFPKEVRNNNLNRLSSFFKQFGAEKIGKAISHVANVLTEQKFQAQYPDMAYTTHEGIDYPALTERLGGKVATHAYYATNARYIQLKDTGIAQTELVNGIKVILSNHAISESDIKQWEMTSVVYGSITKQEKVTQTLKPALGKYIQPKATASSEDQKRLANRGSRIATLSLLNDAIRKSNPDDAYSDSEIQSAADEKIDEGIDWLISKQQPTKKITTKGTVIADKAENIQDLGEKIGGARKDTSNKTGATGTKKAVDDRPTWAKRFSITELTQVGGLDQADDGKWIIRDNKSKDWTGQARTLAKFDTEQEAKDALPLLAVAIKHRVTTGSKDENGDYNYEIWRNINERKRVKVVDKSFKTHEEAMQYMAQHAQAILETNTTFGESDLPVPENKQRTGKAHRDGDVNGESFMHTFGIRGVEFGNWNNQDERQEVMNAAYDGLMDLSEVLSIPPAAIGLNGELALAFGARGAGLSSAKAHYELQKSVINLTKMNGAGALAHEWLHALDHYLGRLDGKADANWVVAADGTRSFKVTTAEDSFVSSGFKRNSGVREELRNAFKHVMDTIFHKAEIYISDTKKADDFVAIAREDLAKYLDNLRKDLSQQKDIKYYKRNNKPASADQLIEFDTVASQLLNGDALDTQFVLNEKQTRRLGMAGRRTNEQLDKISAIYKAVRGRSGFDAAQDGVLDNIRRGMDRYDQRLKQLAFANSTEEKTKKVPTSFAMDAKELDQGRGGDYWTSAHEMAARAFQGYVEDKMAEQAGRNPFLNYAPANFMMLTPWGGKRVFPHGEERKAINAAFDKFVAILETKETEKGTALFSKSTTPVVNPHSKTSLNQAVTKAMDTLFGQGWTNRLMATGKFKMISAAEATGLIGKNAMFHKVWHGSPHDHNGFDSNKIGTGEGAQAFGWGHYFSDLKTVAEWYRDTLQKKQVKLLVDGKDVTELAGNSYSIERRALGILLDELKYPNMGAKNGLSEDQIKTIIDKVILEQTPRSGENDPNYLKSLEKIRDYLTDLKNKKLEIGKGKLYEVDLAPKQDEYLDWDKPLSQQSDVVKAGLKELHKQLEGDLLNEYLDRINADWSELTGQELYQKILQRSHQDGLFDHPDIYDRSVPDDEASSHLLHSLGIRGIRYKAEAGQSDANNYVVFNDADVKIEVKYSKNGDVIAFYNPANDTTYLVHDNITQNTSDKALQGLMLHEIGVHALTLGKSNEAFKDILRRFEALKKTNPKVQAAFDRVPKDTKSEDIVEEALAYYLEENPKSSLAQRIVEWFRQAVRALGKTLPVLERAKFSQWANKLTEAELIGMATSALKSAPDSLQFDNVGRNREGIKLSGENNIKFSRSTPSNTPADNSAMRSFFAPAKGKQALGWLAGLFQRNHLIDFVAQDLPELINYKLLSQEKDNFTNQRENEIGKSYKEMLDKLDKKTMHELGRVQGMATRLVKFDPALADNNTPMTEEELAAYDAYTAMPESAKEAYATMRKDHQDDLTEKNVALIERIKAFPADKETQAEIIRTIEQHFDQFKEGVYFPLNRDGAVIVKATNAEGELVIEHVATQADAYKLVKEMTAQGYDNTHIIGKDAYDRDLLAGNAANEMAALAHKTISDLKEKSVQGKLTESDFNDLFSEFNQLLINTLPDSSYRKHFIHRKGTLGESTDTLRAYSKTRVSAVKMIASLTYDHQIQDVLNNADKAIKEMDKVAGSDTLAIKSIVNELKLREAALKSTEINAVSQVLTSLGFMGALGFNIGSAAVNMLQVVGVALPELIGRHGYIEATKEVSAAYKLLFNPANLDKASGLDITKNPHLSAIAKQAMEYLVRIGKIDLTMTHDSIAAGKDPSYSSNPATRAFGAAAKYSGYFFHVAEAANRQITGMAAFNLAYKKNGGNFKAAIAEAVDVIDRTQFDYGQGNRARYMMSNTARVLTLFKAYALGMSYYIGRNAYQYMKGETPEVRLQARKTLFASMAMSFATAGLFGMPIGIEAFAGIGGVAAFKYKGAKFAVPGAIGGMLIFQALLAGLGADDEDELETEFRNWLTDNFDQTTAEWVTKGPARLLPIGDIASRTSQSELWWRSQNKQLEGTDQYNAIATALIGPIGSQIAGLFTAKKMYEDGQYSRMVESMSPAFLRNAIAANRMGSEGVTNLKGDKIIQRDLTPVELINKVIGFNPTVVTNTYDANSAIAKESTKHTIGKSHLVNRWMSGDATERSDLMKGAIKDFNESVPPSERITLKSLFKSMRSRKGIDKHTQNGLYLSKKQNYLRDIGRFNRQE